MDWPPAKPAGQWLALCRSLLVVTLRRKAGVQTTKSAGLTRALMLRVLAVLGQAVRGQPPEQKAWQPRLPSAPQHAHLQRASY